MKDSPHWKSDAGAGILALTLAFLYAFFSLDYGASGAAMATDSSGAYTDIVAGCMALCGALCLGRAALRARKGSSEKKAETRAFWNTPRIAGAVAVLAAYIESLPWAGFLISSFVAGAVFLLILGERRWRFLLSVPAAWSLAVYALFNLLLHIPLPLPFFM